MALAIVGGAVLSAALGALFDRAVPKREFFTSCFRMSKFKQKERKSVGELRERLLSHSLLAIKQVLDDSTDVEDMQVLKPEVRKWLNDLAEVLYDVEDFLDETDGKDLLQVDEFLDQEEAVLNQEEADLNQEGVLGQEEEGVQNHEEDIVSPQQNTPQVLSYPEPSSTLSTRSRLRCLFQCFPALSSRAPRTLNPLQSPSHMRLMGCSSCTPRCIKKVLTTNLDMIRTSATKQSDETCLEEGTSDENWLDSPTRTSVLTHGRETSDASRLYLPSRRSESIRQQHYTAAVEQHSDPHWLSLPSRSWPQHYTAAEEQQSDPRWLYTPRGRVPPIHPMESEMVSWTFKVESLCKRLDELQTKMGILDLKKGVKGEPADKLLPTTAIPDEDHLSGRVEELGRIIEFPRQNAGNAKKVSLIAIWGMPGVGKTSLAQHVYYDTTFNGCFDVKAWVCVSDDFNVVRFTKMILEAVSEQRFDTDDLNILQVILSNRLSGMRLLLVLDDVWNANFDSWDALLKPLKVKSKETVVILTTRNSHVSISSNADVTLQLGLLSPDDCYSIIRTHATPHGTQVVDEMLDDGCRKIALKCSGLPLAAKAAGRLLRATPRNKWGCIMNSGIWDLVNDATDVLPALMLSYQYLPSHLKPCFSYCSLFPKDYIYDEKKLILLWIAEGFVKQPQDGKSIMEEGQAYFDELFSRSFFQRSSSNTSYFVMHDLFQGLAQFVSNIFFRRVDHSKKGRIPSEIRHLSHQRRTCDNLKLNFQSWGHLRTFIAIDSPGDYFYASLRAMNDLVPMLTSIRVLSLSHYQIYHLSASVGDLKHLRFLDVSFTKIKGLPSTICNLRNLQILLLSHCSELTELPPDMHTLTSLWHLDLSGSALTNLLLNMPDLSKLHAVGKIVGDPSELHKLRDLKHLQDSLCVSISKGMASQTHSSDSYLQHFKGLQELQIDFISASHDSDIQAEVLRLLEPHCGLKNLSIHGYIGRSFPDWVRFLSFSHVVSLQIINCEFCLLFPSLGELPSLEHLHLSGFRNVRRVGAELYGNGSQRITAFKSLKTLIFENMHEWEEWLPWEGGGCDFGCLKELYIRNCPKLSGRLPSNIPSLEKLVISKCPQLNAAPHIFPFIRISESIVPDNTGTVSRISSVELSFLPQLRRLPQDIFLLTSLTSLEVSNIPTIESFPDSPFPESLLSLRIDECNALRFLPSRLVHIVKLVISRCPFLESFPENGLPPSLKILKIKQCEKLQFTSFQDMPRKSNLTTLEIEDHCDSLGSFALGSFPELYHLKISNCKNLESVCFASPGHDLHLLHVYISECTKLGEISVPEGGLPAPSLQELTLSRCSSLKSLPRDMFKRLTSLQSLNLDYCPELRPVLDWPNLASGLVSLSCNDAIFNSVWLNRQLHHFLALKNLTLDGLEVENFPQYRWVPSGVTALTISDFPNLKNIDEGIMDLKCLEEFVIRNCPQVESFPAKGFPSSLLYLQVVGCPLLEQDMLGKGRIKVSYIPCVIVGYIVI